jgi:16S rRNA G527 N7-methylase RsmG
MISQASLDGLSNISRLSSQAIINKYDKSGKIILFLDGVLSYNNKVNLVSRETSLEVLIKFAADCLAPFEFLPTPSGDIFDIGPGGGFPSIILLLSFTGLRGTLFERTEKKARFLNRIVKEFDINAKVIGGDFIENAKNCRRSSFDYGFMKYVKADRNILSTVESLLKPDGSFIYYSRYETGLIAVPKSMGIKSITYYLDDDPQVHTVSIFSSKK